MVLTDPAPALGRGLELIRILDREGPLTLERLTVLTGWPKSSLLRLLTSLCRHQVADRDSGNLHFRLRQRLLPVAGDGDPLQRVWEGLLPVVPSAYPHTLELHAWNGRDLTMVERREPEVGEVRVHARIGWRRNLDEFDALTQVVLAFTDHALDASLWTYGSRGRRIVSGRQRQTVLTAVTATGCAMDLAANPNGVVRSARAVLAADGRLLGAIAAAQIARVDLLPDPVPPLPSTP